jgi:uncharacterized protein (DUF1330 family)
MLDSKKPAYLVACGTALGGTLDPEYYELSEAVALKANPTPLANRAVGSMQVKVLEGELPAGASFLVVEQFPSMAAIEEMYFSDAYQAAIPFRSGAVKMNFLIALEGISEAELEALHEAKKQSTK